MVLISSVCQSHAVGAASVEPDALVFSALLVEEQGNQSDIENEADGSAPKDATRDVVVDANGRSESEG